MSRIFLLAQGYVISTQDSRAMQLPEEGLIREKNIWLNIDKTYLEVSKMVNEISGREGLILVAWQIQGP